MVVLKKIDKSIKVEKCLNIEEHINELISLLIDVVEDGASIGMLPPLEPLEAKKYWESVLNPNVILLVAKVNNEIVGSVQLHLCSKQNGLHRAEVAKLMTHPNYQRHGIGRLLMENAHDTALEMGKTLLVLDTREGDPSNILYISLGYIKAGRIPAYALSENGQFDATIIYYKNLM